MNTKYRILLLSAPYIPEYMRNARCDFVSLSSTQWYPILLGYCGSYLESLNHQVKIIDAPSSNLNHEQTKNIIFTFNPDLIVLYTGFMSENNDIVFIDSIIDELKCDAVIVGPYASINPDKTLSKTRLINKLVVGEFEHPVAEIIEGNNINQIQNLVYKENNLILKNPIRPYLTRNDLDKIPFVSMFFKKHLNLHQYKTPSEPFPYIDIMTGRGCKWGRCTYCLWVHTYIKGNVYNTRSIENVIEEFNYISISIPEVKSVMIQDDTFTEDRIIEFCERKIKSNVPLKWSCYSRGNINYNVLKLMKKAGCLNLHVGYESADPEVLKKIRKGLTVDQMTEFSINANKAKLRVHGDFAFGFPDETPEKALKTIKWAKKIKPYTAQFQIMIPYPSTPYYEEMKNNGWLNKELKPDMPNFTNNQIRSMAKKAYRSFYFSLSHLIKCFCNPNVMIFSKLKTIYRAIPSVLWQKWKV